MRKRQILKGLYKPQLLMGCERIPFIAVIGCSGIIIMSGQTWTVRGIGALFGVIVIIAMRKINKKEPLAFKIAARFAALQKYYLSCAIFPSKPHKPNNLDL